MLASFLALMTAVVMAAESPVRVEAGEAVGAAGSTVELPVNLDIPAGHHVYADMLHVEVLDTAGLAAGTLVEPTGKLVADPANPANQRELYEGRTQVSLPLMLPATASGSYAVKLLVRHQACREGLCYPGVEDTLVGTVRVASMPSVPGISQAGAQVPPVEEPAALFSAKQGAPGEITVGVDLQGDWHINKMFVSLTVLEPAGYTVGELVLPAPHPSGKVEDGTFREDFIEDFDIRAPVTGPDGGALLKVDVGYQACKGISLCRMPTTETVMVPVAIGAGAVAPPIPEVVKPVVAPPVAEAPAATVAATAVGSDVGPSNGGGFAEAAAKGTFWLLLFCFAGGVAVSFTPCVLPMVPITLGLIGARGATSRLEAVSLSGAYVIGQALVYTSLGVFAGVTGGMFGEWLQNQWVLASIGALFVALGFSMFGFFDLQVPSFVQSRISGFEKRGGFVVAFVFGMIGAVLAGPCSGPVVIGILSVVATGGQAAYGAMLMFSFALGMGMIFLVTGAASGWVPKRGAYMVMVKKSFGIVMWLGAIYFAKPLFSTETTALITAGVLLVTGVFSWPAEEDGEGFYAQRLRQLYTVVALLVGAYLLIGTLVSGGFILPPARLAASGSASSPQSSSSIVFIRSEKEALAVAKATGKPLMIDFTAEWCAACHELEKYTYTDPTVVAAAQDWTPVMIDCTRGDDPEIQALQKKYGVRGLPNVVFVAPNGEIVERVVGFEEAGPFKAIMDRAKAKVGA